MPSPRPHQPGRCPGGEPGVGDGGISSCLRWLSFLGNFFDGEMSLDEKFALQVLRHIAATPFDRGNPDHEELLRKLYVLCFAEAETETLKQEDPRWKEIGFQSADPRRDFRGGGLLALQNLCFFRQYFPETFSSLVSKSKKAGFPMAAALINVTHMLAGYLRLTEAVALGAGEPLASRRAIRCFARLCLNAEEEGSAAECCSRHADAFGDSSVLHSPASLPSHSDSEITHGLSSFRRHRCTGVGSAASAAGRHLPIHLQLPRAIRQGCAVPARHCIAQRRSNTDARVLNAFGHLYVYSCMRLEQELSRRGAWEPDGLDPPLPSPRQGSHLLAALRRHHEFRSSHGQLLSPRPHGGNNTRHSAFGGFSPRQGDFVPVPREHQPQPRPERPSIPLADTFDDLGGEKPGTASPSRSTAGQEEMPSSPTSGAPSLVPSPRTDSSCLPAGTSCKAGVAGGCSRQSEEEEGELLHRRAHLCFGDALKDVRNAVDAVLSDGAVQKMEDMGAICRAC